MGGGGRITEIAVTAERMARITPCGGCRQRLAEFAGPDAKLYLCDETGVVETVTMGEMLPYGFEGRILEMMEAVDVLVERLDGLAPTTALVLGSGLGGLVDEVEDALRIPYADLPGFPHSGVTGHAGEVVAGRLRGRRPVLMLAGRAHYYEHGDAAAMRPALEVLAGLGITKLILTNAAGSVDPGHGARLGDADHRPHQFLRLQPAVRRADRPPLRRPDRSL